MTEKKGPGIAGRTGMGEAARKRRAAAANGAEVKEPVGHKIPGAVFAQVDGLMVPGDLMQRISYHYETWRAVDPQNGLAGIRDFMVRMLVGMVGLLDQAEEDANRANVEAALTQPREVEEPAKP